MYLRLFVRIDPSSESSSVDYSSIESKINSSSATLQSFPTKSTPSNCDKVIILPVCSCDNVVYGIYKTSGCAASASAYRLEVYAPYIFSNKTSCEEIMLRVQDTYITDPIQCYGIPKKRTQKLFCE